MPKTYKRKTDRQSWSQEGMELAITEVMSGRMGYKKAFNVPQSTLEDKDEDKKIKDGEKKKKPEEKKNKSKKRKLFEDAKKEKQTENKHPKKEKPKEKVWDDSSEEEDENTACIYCNELYSDSKSGEGWIQCTQCRCWAHENCSGAEEKDDYFTCDLCQTVSRQ